MVDSRVHGGETCSTTLKSPNSGAAAGWAQGRTRGPSGPLNMYAIRSNPVERAPWGRKRFYAPLPVLSVLLLATALAAPSIIHTDFLIYEDSGLSIVARVNQVIHLSGSTGTIVGTMTVTNTHSFDIQVQSLDA